MELWPSSMVVGVAIASVVALVAALLWLRSGDDWGLGTRFIPPQGKAAYTQAMEGNPLVL